jgi:transcriptional regulator with GAF, ATPase, and Fis domain
LARVLEQVATTSSTVQVSGEIGKSKELVARAIYQRSNLRKCLFVTVNCAALPAIPFGD